MKGFASDNTPHSVDHQLHSRELDRIDKLPSPTPTALPPAIPTDTPAPVEPEPVASSWIVSPVIYEPGSFEAIICQYDWPCGEAIAVAACESGRGADGQLDGNWASSGSSFGIFEINEVHVKRWPDMFLASADGITPNWADPVWNISHAYVMWAEQGWRPWSCRPY